MNLKPESRQELIQRYADKYIDEHGPASARDIANALIERGAWMPDRKDLVDILANYVSRAMREEYITDPQGRTVRAKHSARITQGDGQTSIWADIRTAEPAHMEIAFKQRRVQIVGDCRQLKRDVDSYNDNRCTDRLIQMPLDFTQDVAELELMDEIEKLRAA